MVDGAVLRHPRPRRHAGARHHLHALGLRPERLRRGAADAAALRHHDRAQPGCAGGRGRGGGGSGPDQALRGPAPAAGRRRNRRRPPARLAGHRRASTASSTARRGIPGWSRGSCRSAARISTRGSTGSRRSTSAARPSEQNSAESDVAQSSPMKTSCAGPRIRTRRWASTVRVSSPPGSRTVIGDASPRATAAAATAHAPVPQACVSPAPRS